MTIPFHVLNNKYLTEEKAFDSSTMYPPAQASSILELWVWVPMSDQHLNGTRTALLFV